MKVEGLALIFVLLSGVSDGSRILIYYPTIGISHVLPVQALAKSLAERNHEITFVSPFPLSKPVKNYRDIKLENNDDATASFISEVTKNPKNVSMFQMMSKMPQLIFKFGNETLQSKEVRRLMKEEQFDLVIVGFFFTDFGLGLADHFKCPSIVFSHGAGSFWTLNRMVGNPTSLSTVPSGFIRGEMTSFINRLKTFFLTGVEVAIAEYMKYYSKQVYEYNFPKSEGYISYEEAHNNVSLVFMNSHFSGASVRPLLPNMVEVGGLQVKPVSDPLPEKLQAFLDGAKQGAILFTLGSNSKSKYLPEQTLKILLTVFSKLKQRVVMKWESDVLEGKPDNVFVGTWLPQDDILAHPNIKLFISHCGLGGVVEARHHGVPIIGLPVYGDQPKNAEEVASEGWGIQMDLMELTETSLMESINEIITVPRYSEIAKKLSALTRDRPMNAKDTAVYWVEYVLRHRGAPHIHYAGADLNFLQYNSYDIIGLLLLILWISGKTIKFVVVRLCCRKKILRGKGNNRKKTN
ncbi:UDP-glucosyltransferase 2 [Pseudolycoriella hygida]|uniref:UDP-glucosyltransferase 2 n=1 Tax=Pseudolycoriella hygida TaxID=35572 RepID=A0A9Q0MQ39_9DIPT|nr:UDP-glucosyltransferase 2 [Pseudolycoriella hygida]